MTARYDIEGIKDALRLRLGEMIADQLPGARKAGRNWFVGSLRGEKGQSLCVWYNGAFRDYATGQAGDVLKLYAELYQGGGMITAPVIAAAAGFVDMGPDTTLDAADRARREADRARRLARDEKETAEALDRKRKYWAAQWYRASACQRDDPVWSYLKHARGLDPAAFLQDRDRLPGAIKFHPEFPIWFGQEKRLHPAMLCQMLGLLPPDDRGARKIGTLAVHATYLERRGDRWCARYEGSNKRRVYAAAKGAMIPVWKPDPKVPFTKAPRAATLVVCEGVETALTGALVTPEFYHAAAYSLTNLEAIQCPSPDGFDEVVICAEDKWKGGKNLETVRRAQDRIVRSGRKCRVIFSEEGSDLNDWWQADREAQPAAGRQPATEGAAA